MRDARAEVAGGVDGVAGRPTERDADRDHEDGDGQRAEGREAAALLLTSEPDHHEDEDEGAHDLGDEVPAVGADRGTGGEDAELVRGLGLIVEVLLVGEPHDDRTEDRSEHLSGEIHQNRREVDGDTGSELLRTARDEPEGDRGVEVGAGVVGHDDTGVDREAPAERDHEEAAVEPLVLGEGDVGDNTTPEQYKHCGADEFRQEDDSEIVHDALL